jgi:hypothetical protein
MDYHISVGHSSLHIIGIAQVAPLDFDGTLPPAFGDALILFSGDIEAAHGVAAGDEGFQSRLADIAKGPSE